MRFWGTISQITCLWSNISTRVWNGTCSAARWRDTCPPDECPPGRVSPWTSVPPTSVPPDNCPPGQVSPQDICPPRSFVPPDNSPPGQVSPRTHNSIKWSCPWHLHAHVPVKVSWACSWSFHEHRCSWESHEHAHEGFTSKMKNKGLLSVKDHTISVFSYEGFL